MTSDIKWRHSLSLTPSAGGRAVALVKKVEPAAGKNKFRKLEGELIQVFVLRRSFLLVTLMNILEQ